MTRHATAGQPGRTAGVARPRVGGGRARPSPTTARRYLAQVELSLRPSTVSTSSRTCASSAPGSPRHAPRGGQLADLDRHHIEAYKTWLADQPPAARRQALQPDQHQERADQPALLLRPDHRMGLPDAPPRPLIFAGDLPILDQPLPRFLDDAAAAKLLRAARAEPDPFARLVVELLARTGMRKGELLGLTVDAVVQIGSAYWLRIPIGKLHNDRYIPLHPQLKTLLDDWLADHRPDGLRSDLIFCSNAAGRSPATARRHGPRPSRRRPPGSATSPPTSCATPWPPRPSTEA